MSSVIPDGWGEHRQGDVADFSNGKAYKLTEWEKVGTPVIRLQNLTGSGKNYYYSNLKLPDRQYCESGDLLYMWSATFGPHIWKGPKAIYHYHIWKITCNETDLTKRFLYQLLGYKTAEWLNQSNGMGILHITKGGMEELKLILPPLPEQQKIAQILTSVDEVIEKTQAQIDKLKDLKTAMMQELLTKGIGHVEFKDTPVGRIPVGWGLTTLGEIGKWKGGGTPSKANESYWRGQIPWVSPKDVKVEYISKTKDSISMEAILGSSTNLVEKGSLLIVVRSGILQHTLPIAIANCDLTINQDMKALTLSPNFCALYVYHYLLANNHNVLRATLKAGNTVESIDFAAFTTYQIPSPPLIEQVKIADAVESVAINIRKKEQAMCSYKNMKKALMQDLLTGKVRVCVNE
tara:strand:- start:1814 stop:3028 length:1215 start_codon:yes stop_codon:yes gene_type:complete